MTPDDYRYYHLDGLGQIQGAEWLDAASDEDAIAQLKSKHADGTSNFGKASVWSEGFVATAAARSLLRQSKSSVPFGPVR